MSYSKEASQNIRSQILGTLQNQIIPFWLDRSIDTEFGGYQTSFDGNGHFDGNKFKHIVTQSRMLWGFSNLRRYTAERDLPRLYKAASHGAFFLTNQFWDKEHGGFYWTLNRDGSVYDACAWISTNGKAQP